MKKIILFGFILISGLATQALTTVPYVNVDQFIGRWYQIAKNPLPFEPAECPCAQQTLGLNSAGTVDVYNSCNKNDFHGPLQEIRGTAYPADATNSKLIVDFGFQFKGEYWIIALDKFYQWAVITDSQGRSLYILSKTQELAPDVYERATAEASYQLDISKLKITAHQGCQYPQ